MMENSWGIATVWMGLALLASFLSIRFKLSVALVEILVGIAAGNLAVLLEAHHLFGLRWHLESNEWIKFLAGFGSILLTFMAGRRSSQPSCGGTSRRAWPSASPALPRRSLERCCSPVT